MLKNKRHKFELDDEVAYFNNAYMSPSLKSVTKAGIKAVKAKGKPNSIFAKDFFEPVDKLKKSFAKLIDCDNHERIAVIPSASYGISTVVNNIHLKEGDEIIVLQDQFPSNYYSWLKLANSTGAKIKIVSKPEKTNQIGMAWNAAVLDLINHNTAVVAMCHVHWADGTLFDLQAIRKKTNENNALLIIDGTQSVGALPFSIKTLQPDALICSGYKWLMGPYGTALAYFGPHFDDGSPIEENWLNRDRSEDFAGLVNYVEKYKPFAHRYSSGEHPNFVAIAMLLQAIEQINKWSPEAIQEYCKIISREAIDSLLDLGCHIEPLPYRAHHLFGIGLPESIKLDDLKNIFRQNNLYASIRGNYVRIALHVYNSKKELKILTKCITKASNITS